MNRVLTALSVLTFAATTQAQTVLDQPPNQAFSLIASAGVQACADDLIVTKAAGVTITALDLYGGWIPNGTAVNDTFDVVIHRSVLATAFPFEEIPGPAIASFPGLSAAVVSTGNLLPTYMGPVPEYRVAIPLPMPVDLPPGQYWFEAYSTASSGTGEEFQWGMTDTDPVHGGKCINWSAQTPGVSWNPCTPYPATAMAMTVYGAPSGPSLYVDNLVSGATATFRFEDASPFGAVFTAFSTTGSGPLGTPWGDLLLTPPYYLLPLAITDMAGAASLNFAIAPGYSGVPLWFHTLDWSSSSFTNGVATTIG